MNGHWDGQTFVSDVDLDAIDEQCVHWLRALGSREPMSIRTPRERYVPVALGTEAETLREYRKYFGRILVTAVGDRVRAISNWVPEGWLSLLSGTTAVGTFDWRAEWAVIEPLFRILEPFTRTAVVTRVGSIHGGAAATHARRRELRPHASGSAVGRALEQHGLVDAEGRFFVSEPPRGIDPRWIQKPYGYLTQVDAPDLGAWLDHRPSEDTIADGRRDLASLLRENRWSDTYGVIPPDS